MIKDFTLGIKSYIDALHFLWKRKFWLYVIIPFFVFIGIYYIGISLKDVKHFYLPKEDDGMGIVIAYYFLDGIILLVVFALLNFTRYIMLAIISPILSMISQRTEKLINNKKYGFSLKQIVHDVKRALKLILRNIILEALTILGIILLFYILNIFFENYSDQLSIIENIMIIVIAFYYYGFAFMDYSLERWKIDEKKSVQFVRKHKGLALAIGAVFTPIFHYLNEFITSYTHSTDHQIKLVFIVISSALISAIFPVWSMIASTIAMEKITYLDDNLNEIEENP